MRSLLVILPLLAAALMTAGCGDDTARSAAALTGGDPARGRAVIRAYGCGACHTIPGIPAAEAVVGPPLTGFARRHYVGGVLQNTPDNLIRWIRDPQAVDSLTAMPRLGLSEAEARDAAAYLYTLHEP